MRIYNIHLIKNDVECSTYLAKKMHNRPPPRLISLPASLSLIWPPVLPTLLQYLTLEVYFCVWGCLSSRVALVRGEGSGGSLSSPWLPLAARRLKLHLHSSGFWGAALLWRRWVCARVCACVRVNSSGGLLCTLHTATSSDGITLVVLI